MMIIQINEKYRIEKDVMAWAIARYRKHKDPTKKQWVQIRWYAKLEQAARGYLEIAMGEATTSGADEAIAEIKRIEAELKQALQGVGDFRLEEEAPA